MTSMAKIEEFGRNIGEEFHPQRVVLFGSYAYGTPTPDSDVDILVLMPFEGRGHQMATQIRRRIRPEFPLDLLVRTPETVRERISMGDGFLREITEQGKVLYESSDT